MVLLPDKGGGLSVRTNLEGVLEENAPVTPSSARRALNAVSTGVSGVVNAVSGVVDSAARSLTGGNIGGDTDDVQTPAAPAPAPAPAPASSNTNTGHRYPKRVRGAPKN